MGFLEAVADKGVYKKFAKAYMAAETFSRRAKAMAAMYKSFQLQTKWSTSLFIYRSIQLQTKFTTS